MVQVGPEPVELARFLLDRGASIHRLSRVAGDERKNAMEQKGGVKSEDSCIAMHIQLATGRSRKRRICVPMWERRHSVRRLLSPDRRDSISVRTAASFDWLNNITSEARSHECERGTQECVRHENAPAPGLTIASEDQCAYSHMWN